MVVKKQMAFMTWRQGVDLPFEEMGMDELVQCGSGELLSQHYLALAKELVRQGRVFESPEQHISERMIYSRRVFRVGPERFFEMRCHSLHIEYGISSCVVLEVNLDTIALLTLKL